MKSVQDEARDNADSLILASAQTGKIEFVKFDHYLARALADRAKVSFQADDYCLYIGESEHGDTWCIRVYLGHSPDELAKASKS